jgi:hypothetical protein
MLLAAGSSVWVRRPVGAANGVPAPTEWAPARVVAADEAAGTLQVQLDGGACVTAAAADMEPRAPDEDVQVWCSTPARPSRLNVRQAAARGAPGAARQPRPGPPRPSGGRPAA